MSNSEGRFYLDTGSGAGHQLIRFCYKILEKSGVLITPGTGFGDEGEGFIRIALTVEEDRMKEVVKRIEDAGFVY